MTNLKTRISLKQEQREALANIVDAYMARAGHIEQVPQGVTRFDALIPRTAAQKNAAEARLQKMRASDARFEIDGDRWLETGKP